MSIGCKINFPIPSIALINNLIGVVIILNATLKYPPLSSISLFTADNAGPIFSLTQLNASLPPSTILSPTDFA